MIRRNYKQTAKTSWWANNYLLIGQLSCVDEIKDKKREKEGGKESFSSEGGHINLSNGDIQSYLNDEVLFVEQTLNLDGGGKARSTYWKQDTKLDPTNGGRIGVVI
ncbi:uncharacterized protein LOC124928658 [Impatiens glandulifera]|uniref:uncharacterized protein LOC124928658 n=1 Tax=Impatiens glandulifera TaxID=253017 RepID=UPI001FB12611|nr:uncharacterized protein LOC124928658 [Impatiens glandulifera]